MVDAGLLLQVIDALDIGVLVIDRARALRFANAVAREALRDLGGQGMLLPPVLDRCLEGSVEARLEGFSPGVGVDAGEGRQYLVRWRELDHGDRLMLLVLPAQRSGALSCQIRERFGTTIQEARIAVLIRNGRSNQEIADELALSISTIKTYVSRLFVACGVRSRTRLIVLIDELEERGLPTRAGLER